MKYVVLFALLICSLNRSIAQCGDEIITKSKISVKKKSIFMEISVKNNSKDSFYLQSPYIDSTNNTMYRLSAINSGGDLFKYYREAGVSSTNEIVVYPKLYFYSIGPSDSVSISFIIPSNSIKKAYLFLKFSKDKDAFIYPESYYYKSFDKLIMLNW